MRRDLVVLTSISLAVAQSAAAGTRQKTRRTDDNEMREAAAVIAAIADAMGNAGARRGEAAGLLKEAVRTGTADAEAFATIAAWILYEKEEKVAAGLADVLGAVGPTSAGRDGARWNAATQAMLRLFTSVLRDAQNHRRVDPAEADARMSAVVAAAAPAVADALREAGMDACVVDAAAKALKKIEASSPKGVDPLGGGGNPAGAARKATSGGAAAGRDPRMAGRQREGAGAVHRPPRLPVAAPR